MKRTKLLILIIVFIFTNSIFVNANAMKSKLKVESTQTLTISAAASLKDVLSEIQRDFEKQNKGIKVVFNFGGSGTLEKQIEAGAPVDVFISADTKNVKKLNDKNLIDKNSIKDVATNQLVLVSYIGNSSKVRKIDDIAKPQINSICLGTLGSVPAGDYAKETLVHYNLWDKVNKKIIYAKDVTTVLNYVNMGNADVGFVYLTDAKKKTDAIIKQIIPNDSHSPIIYEGVVLSSTPNKDASKKFMDCLSTARSRIIFGKYGFGSIQK